VQKLCGSQHHPALGNFSACFYHVSAIQGKEGEN